MRWHSALLAGLALLVLLSGVGVLLAPVVADDPVVNWPRAGEQPRSTVLPLVPYRPLSLDTTVPCAALSTLNERDRGGDALRTLPATADRAGRIGQGLVVTVHSGTVQITASGATLLREPLPVGGCSYRVVAGDDGIRVLRDGAVRAAAGGQVPQVAELATDVEGLSVADGLTVTLHTDARYESTPTALKTGLLVLHAAALLSLLGLALCWFRGRAAPIQWPRPRAADAVLVVVSAAWVLLAPLNFDDPWYLLMARGAAGSGSIGNAIYMFNATENPFVASQYVLQMWGSVGGWGLVWMRLVPLIYGLATWVLLRLLLTVGFGRELTSARAVWALLVAHLLWWLPYGMTLRPEPLIALLAAATLLLADLARRRRSVGVLAAATATAALAVSVAPSGLVAAAPLVLALPWLWIWLREAGALPRVTAVLLLAAAVTVLVPVGFADATLGDVLESNAVHQWYYQTFSWFEEIVHYQTVLTLPDSSQWARRAPVVLTVAVLVVVAVGSGREAGEGDPVVRLLLGSAVCSAIALGLLALTPTKWVNHFGAVAAVATVLLAAALLRSPLQGRAGGIAATAGAALLVGAVSLSFAGPNLWRPHSDRGQPFGDHFAAMEHPPKVIGMRPTLGPVPLASPALWVAVAVAAACWVWWWRRRGRESSLTADRAVLVAGSVTIVALMLGVFGWAPLRQYPGWSVALSNANTFRGQPCKLSTYAQVLMATPAQPVPAGAASVDGAFAAASQLPSPVPPPAPGSLVWHDALPEGQETGLLVTPWFTLPPRHGTDLLVPLLGTRAGQRLTLEYATVPGANPPVAGSAPLPVDPSVPGTDWQQAAVSLDGLGRQRPVSVRLVVQDRITGPDSWLAVGQPRLAAARPLATLTAGRAVYVDQVTATLLPCVDQVGVRHGIARAPEVLVLADEGFDRDFLDLGFEVFRGGTQVQADRSATTVRVPSSLVPSGPPTLPWGRVERVVYDHPVGLVDLHINHVQRSGWTRLPTLADLSYHGDL
ncbi:MAG: arabinosyltransferase domain-containing protein [Pseudonocardiaceae bacterium]